MRLPTILVVEDDPTIRATLQVALEEDGYEVLLASQGQEGFELLHGQRPGVIVLDLMMPGLNGWTFIERLRSLPELAQLPVVVVSALAPEAAARGLDAQAFVSKPFQVDHLLNVVSLAQTSTASMHG